MTGRAKALVVLAVAAALLCGASLLAAVVFLRVIKIAGGAMEPGLRDGDRVLVSRAVGKIERGDLIIFYFPKDTSVSYLKRVIGLPGEAVELRGGAVFVDGRPLAEPYARTGEDGNSRDVPAVVVPERSYFVLGDNRDYSYDSRYWGFVPRELIYGKVVGR
jgi:signal peptidase I